MKDLGKARSVENRGILRLRAQDDTVSHWLLAFLRLPTFDSPSLRPVPFPEELEQLIPDAGIQILFAERARDVDGGPHLVEISSTALARLEVSVEPLSIGFRKRAVQIVTDNLNQFPAGQFASIRSHYLHPFQIPFQLPSHLRARPVQQDPLMGLRDRQDVTDLRGREAFDVTHGDDDSLIRGKASIA